MSVVREVKKGSVVKSRRADVGICIMGKKEVPRRSPGSRSVNLASGVVWWPSATKILVSELTPSGGSMSTRWWPVRAGIPEGRTKLTGTRDGVDESKNARTRAKFRWNVSFIDR